MTSITEPASAGIANGVAATGWGKPASGTQMGTEFPKTVCGITINAIYTQDSNGIPFIELAGDYSEGVSDFPHGFSVSDSLQSYSRTTVEDDSWLMASAVDKSYTYWQSLTGTDGYVVGQTYGGLITCDSPRLNEVVIEQSGPYNFDFKLSVETTGSSNGYVWYTTNALETRADIKTNGQSNDVRATDRSLNLSLNTAFNGSGLVSQGTSGNFNQGIIYYAHYFIEWPDATETRLYHEQITLDSTLFPSLRLHFENQAIRRKREDIDRTKILFLYNSDTSNFPDEENMVDDYIEAYGLTAHKIAVHCNTAANFNPTTIWNSWMSGVADYMENNGIQAVFLSPNFKHWIPYPTPIVDGQAAGTDGNWSSGCATQMASSIPMIKKMMTAEGTTDYSDLDVNVLVSDVAWLDPLGHSNRSYGGHVKFHDLVGSGRRGDQNSEVMHLGGIPVGQYSPDWNLSVSGVLGVAGTASAYSSEQDFSSSAIPKDLQLSIAQLQAANMLDRVPGGRLGAAAVTGTGSPTTGTYTNSPSITRAQLATIVSKSQATRGSIESHKGKLFVASTIMRLGQDIAPQQAIISHKMWHQMGLRNLLVTSWDDDVANDFQNTDAAIKLIADRSGDSLYDEDQGFTPDIVMFDSTQTGNREYNNPGSGGDYDVRTSGAGFDTAAYGSTTFPLEKMFMWMGQGWENTDKDGTGHIWNSGNFATLADGAIYQSSTSFGMHLGRWFILEGGSVAIGALRLELETDPVSPFTNNEIAMMHHTSLEIDSSPSFQANIMRGHSAAYSEFFQVWSNIRHNLGTGFAKSQELWGDPLHTPFALQATAEAPMKIVTYFICGDATNISPALTDGFGTMSLGANIVGRGASLLTSNRRGIGPSGTIGSSTHSFNVDLGDEHTAQTVTYTSTGGDTDEDVCDGWIASVAGNNELKNEVRLTKVQNASNEYGVIFEYLNTENYDGAQPATFVNCAFETGFSRLSLTGNFGQSIRIEDGVGRVLSNLAILDLGPTSAGGFFINSGFMLVISDSGENGYLATANIGAAVPINSLRIMDDDLAVIAGSTPNLTYSSTLLDVTLTAADFKAAELGATNDYLYHRLSSANGAENRLLGLIAGKRYRMEVEFNASNLGISGGGGANHMVEDLLGNKIG